MEKFRYIMRDSVIVGYFDGTFRTQKSHLERRRALPNAKGQVQGLLTDQPQPPDCAVGEYLSSKPKQ